MVGPSSFFTENNFPRDSKPLPTEQLVILIIQVFLKA